MAGESGDDIDDDDNDDFSRKCYFHFIPEVRYVSAYHATTNKPRERVTLRSPKSPMSPRRSTPLSREGSRNGKLYLIKFSNLFRTC